MEETMGPARHIKRSIPSADSASGKQDNGAPRRPAGALDAIFDGAASTCDETDIWRLARRMRQEWRQQRYSRLKAA
jgi:hypothetical protein